ncbi:MAG TPA: DUF4185 domain-containing protein [Verrucomicrobiae bacterium]|jgi:hypothetical protein|nr:DUF4185 domain-containing protein [Verrucomicrobiae bacterium]
MKLYFNFITLGLAVFVSGCSTSTSTKTQAGAPFEIVQCKSLGTIWNNAYARASIISQDGGESFAVPGGAIWAFGDSFKGSRSADGAPHYAGGAESCTIAFLPTNSPPYPPALNYFVSTNGAISPFAYFPDEPPKRYRIWPLGGVYLNGQSYLYYSRIEIFGPGPWDFRSTGSGLARCSIPLGHYERLQPHGDWHFPVSPTQVLAADGWLYLFGITEANHPQGVILARVRPGKIEDPDAYQFYAGAGPQFSPRKDDASTLITNIPGQVSMAWNSYLQKYVMASSSDFFHPREIRFHVADTPCGPWSPPVARVELPAIRQGKRLTLAYCAYLHPELFRQDGRVMPLTYSVGLQDAGFDCNCEMLEIEIKRR